MHQAQVKRIQDLNIKPDALNLIEEGKSLELIGSGGSFLNRTPIAIDKWDLMTLESFCKAKDIVNKTNRQPTDWERNFTNSTSDGELISKLYKELKKLTTKNPNNSIKLN